MPKKYDVIIIGAGPGGYNCAIRCAQLGLSVACVDKRGAWGGVCLHHGCIPSKFILNLSKKYKSISSLSEHGISFSSVSLDMKKVILKKKEMIDNLANGINFLFKKNNISGYTGKAHLRDSHTVDVLSDSSTVSLQADNIVLAVGSTPLVPSSFPPADGELFFSSKEALSLSRIPKTMAVLGAGYIGLEAAYMWASFGCDVTIFEKMQLPLASMDKDISQCVTNNLKAYGIKLNTQSSVKSLKKKKEHSVLLEYETNQGNYSKSFDVCLYALGRKSCVDKYNFGDFVDVDERNLILVDGLRTSKDSIWAIGDCISGPMLAHRAEEDAITCAEMIGGIRKRYHQSIIPSIVYLNPEVGSVGLSEEEAQKNSIPYVIGKFPFSANSRSLCYGEKEGFVKVIAHKETDIILGCHIVGPCASELINHMVLAMEFSASCEDIICCTYGHPTFSEAIRQACMDVHNYAMQC